MSDLEQLKASVIDGEVSKARQLAETAVQAGLSPDAIFTEALSPAMEEVGRRMQRGDYYIPEVLVSAKAMKAAAEVLRPLVVQSGGIHSKGKVVMGTVRGDLHDIGKNLVIMMLEGAGFQVVDLGNDVAPARFVEAVQEHRPEMMGMSALLTTTMLQMPKVIEALQAAGIRSQVKVMVGGAPLNQHFADEIGADGFGMDAAAAVDLARAWAPER